MRNKGNKGQNQQRKNRPNPITAPLTPESLRKQVGAATRVQFRPTQRAIQGEIRASKQRQHQIGNWFNEYLNTVQGQQAETNAAYAAAGNATQGFVNQASALDNANTAKLNAQEAQSAALRGTQASTQPAQTAAAAQAQRNYLSAAYGASNAQRGANQFAYLGEERRIGAGQKVASKIAEGKRQISERQDLKNLAVEKGDFARKYGGELRDKAFEQMIQRRAFPEKQAELAMQQREHQEDLRQAENSSRRTAANSVRSSRTSRANNIEDNKAGGAGGTGSGGERRAAYQAAKSLYNEGRPHENNKGETVYGGEWKSWEELETALRKESEITPAQAHWAVGKLKRQYNAKQRQHTTEVRHNETHGR